MNPKSGLPLLLILILLSSVFGEPRRVLIEFSTGTWCGYCPCGDSIIEHNILNQFPQTTVLAYHGPPNSSSDPFSFFNGNNIIGLIGFSAYPLAIFDRQSGAPMDYDYNWPETCAVRYVRSPNTAINVSFVSKTYNSSTRVLNASVNATALQTLTGQYKINFVIIENNIVYPQNFYSSCGTPGYHSNYVHKWTVRNMVNTATGENVNSGTWNQNQTINKTVSTTIDSAWAANNCNLVVFIYKDVPPLVSSTVEQSMQVSVTGALGISNTNEVPRAYFLSQNYPNPFNPVTNIKYSIPKDGHVSLKIYDSRGVEAAVMMDGFQKAGVYNAEFEGTNYSSGLYFYRLTTDEFTETKKMVLIK